jgi:hypothetical protein
MRGVIPPLSQYAFMVWCSVKSTGTNLRFLTQRQGGLKSIRPLTDDMLSFRLQTLLRSLKEVANFISSCLGFFPLKTYDLTILRLYIRC